MSDNTLPSDYELNEKDIDSALNWLKINHPDQATPEMAIALLEYFRQGIHELAHGASDIDLAELYDRFSKDHNTNQEETDG